MERKQRIYYVTGDEFVARQTVEMEGKWHSSRPRPRNWVMGMRGERYERLGRVLGGDGRKVGVW